VNPALVLEWLHNGEWKRIGWIATTPESKAALREHGDNLAASGGHYRLVTLAVDRVVAHEWGAA
jgi:hypothetical protein